MNNQSFPRDASTAVFRQFTVATMAGSPNEPLGLIERGAVVVGGGRIQWVGKTSDVPDKWRGQPLQIEGQGQLLTPGLVDCHTHSVFGGSRADEWQKRISGTSYQQLAKEGGGIMSTVRATRAESAEELFQSAARRIRQMMAGGVTTIEIKSGYGLDLPTERKMLEVIGQLKRRLPIDIQATALPAHAFPSEWKDAPDRYVRLVCDEILPKCHQDFDTVDVFCESIAFNLEQTRFVLETAKGLGKPIKIHAEQMSLMGGAQLAAEMGALSCDHLEYLDEAGVHAMARSGSVATLLPGAFYFLKEDKRPPVDLLRQHRVPMAVATDFNPGSSPLVSLLLAANMACTLFGLTIEESLLGITRNASCALGFDKRLGTIEPGKQADLVVWDVSTYAELPYLIGHQPALACYKHGKRIDG